MTGHQTAVDALRKTAESLITCEGELLSNTDEIQEAVGEGKKINQSSISQPIAPCVTTKYLKILCRYSQP